MSKLDHAASLTSSDAASTRKATLQQRTTNRKSINTGYKALYLRRKVARVGSETKCPRHAAPNYTAETRSRTRVSREPDGHRQRNPQKWRGTRSETLKLFV